MEHKKKIDISDFSENFSNNSEEESDELDKRIDRNFEELIKSINTTGRKIDSLMIKTHNSINRIMRDAHKDISDIKIFCIFVSTSMGIIMLMFIAIIINLLLK